jgi:uncharacterized protein (DUF2236 family)
MVHGDTLAVGPASREIAASILAPPVFFAVQPAFRLVNFFTVGLLPPVLRERYGLTWSKAQDVLLRAAALSSSVVVPLLPDRVRAFPHARRA